MMRETTAAATFKNHLCKESVRILITHTKQASSKTFSVCVVLLYGMYDDFRVNSDVQATNFFKVLTTVGVPVIQKILIHMLDNKLDLNLC